MCTTDCPRTFTYSLSPIYERERERNWRNKEKESDREKEKEKERRVGEREREINREFNKIALLDNDMSLNMSVN